MRKLIRGIVDFRRNVRPDYRDMFARLALGQKPDTLFIACSDSRVVPNLFASADPGDLFVIRNVGNLIAPTGIDGQTPGEESEGAAIDFAISTLGITDIIVCGHSECGAMQSLLKGRAQLTSPHLRDWLRHGEPAIAALASLPPSESAITPHNRLSQLNVLTQINHLKTYPLVRDRLQAGRLRLHGWWFELKNADVYAYEAADDSFVLIDEKEAERLLKILN